MRTLPVTSTSRVSGIVLRVVAVDRRVAVADDHILLGDRQAALDARGLRRDLDRHIAKAAELRPRAGDARRE